MEEIKDAVIVDDTEVVETPEVVEEVVESTEVVDTPNVEGTVEEVVSAEVHDVEVL